jgi:hypothetical protein
MLRAAGISWDGCTQDEERELESYAMRRLHAEAALAALITRR